MEQVLTFDQLPQTIASLVKEVGELKQLIASKQDQPATAPEDNLLTIQQAAGFLSLTVPTLYTKVSKRAIPHMKRGKRLYFSREDLINYLQEGRRQSRNEIKKEANIFLSNH